MTSAGLETLSCFQAPLRQPSYLRLFLHHHAMIQPSWVLHMQSELIEYEEMAWGSVGASQSSSKEEESATTALQQSQKRLESPEISLHRKRRDKAGKQAGRQKHEEEAETLMTKRRDIHHQWSRLDFAAGDHVSLSGKNSEIHPQAVFCIWIRTIRDNCRLFCVAGKLVHEILGRLRFLLSTRIVSVCLLPLLLVLVLRGWYDDAHYKMCNTTCCGLVLWSQEMCSLFLLDENTANRMLLLIFLFKRYFFSSWTFPSCIAWFLQDVIDMLQQ